MRVRKKKHGAERLEAHSNLLINISENLLRDPQDFFEEKRSLWLEIGCGKGNFACGTSTANHSINLIAMEKISDVVCIAVEKADKTKETRPNNLKFLIGDAKNLKEFFPVASFECICINFCDPWPKSRHAKRRLTSKAFLELYKSMLIPNGILKFKTDNKALFDFSLEEFKNFGLTFEAVSYNLHESEYAEGNVMTEYEKNFSSQGMPIYYAVVRF